MTPTNKHRKELPDWQAILHALPIGLCLFDDQGSVIYANPVYLHIFQQNEEQILGKNIREFISDIKGMGHNQSGSGQVNLMANGVSALGDIRPVYAGGQAGGGVIAVKQDKDLTCLYEQLQIAVAKAEYLEQKLTRSRQASWKSEQMRSESAEQKWLRTVKSGKAFEKFIGLSPVVLEALVIAGKAAKVQSTVLLSGKSGTGKELVAEGIHQASPRAQGPFVRINCAAIPANLLESELFGHEKGAFTGALKRKLGKFELAHKGTIFLDEIGEMDLGMQAKLLRVLQNSQFERVGGEDTIQVDVRIIAATNQNLADMVSEGRFREDLFYRLNVIPVFLPPLKDRKEDIPLLVDFFLKKFNREFGKEIIGIMKTAMDILVQYDWPGNVRELKNIMERMVALTDGCYIEPVDIPACCCQQEEQDGEKSPVAVDSLGAMLHGEIFPLEEYEKQIIRAALNKYGSYTAAGKALGITHKTVAAKAQKYGIDKFDQ